MGEPHVVSALRDKRPELSGLIAHRERQIDRHRADLIHVDAVIRLYAPEIVPETGIPTKAVRNRNSWFRAGECARLVCDLLRDSSEPIQTGAITVSLMEKKGLPSGDVRARESMQQTILGSMGRASKLFERIPKDGRVYWPIKD
ncbi:MAG: hypothetical protein WCJ64_09630 [Rhodospirillaceae bacterium]